MSRSYRRHIWITEGYGGKTRKWMKREANRKVRRAKDVPDHKAYRKYYDSWNICDWKFLYDPLPYKYISHTGELKEIGPLGGPLWKARSK